MEEGEGSGGGRGARCGGEEVEEEVEEVEDVKEGYESNVTSSEQLRISYDWDTHTAAEQVTRVTMGSKQRD